MRSWRGRVLGVGHALVRSARFLAAPLALCLAVTLLPSGTRTAEAASRTALGRRIRSTAASADATAVESALAAVLSNPALGRSLRGLRHHRNLTGFERDLLDAAITASRSSSVLAGRLLRTPATAVDRARLAGLGRELRANPAVARLTVAGATLARQRWPLQATIDRYRATLAAEATAPPGDASGGDVTTLGDVARTDAFRSLVTSLAWVLSDADAISIVASLPPAVVAGVIGRERLVALRLAGDHPMATRPSSLDRVGLPAAVVILATAIGDGSPSAIVTAAAAATAVTLGA